MNNPTVKINAPDVEGDEECANIKEEKDRAADTDWTAWPEKHESDGNEEIKENKEVTAAQGNEEILAGMNDTNLPNGSGTKVSFWTIVIFILLLCGSILLGTSIEKLGSTEYGLEYNVHKKALADAAKTGGLHLGPPGFEFIKFPSTFISVDLPDDMDCVSRDGLRVKVTVSFQYQMPAEWIIPAVLKYRDYEKWSRVVVAAGNSAVQRTCSSYNISNFQNQRGIIQGVMLDNLRLKLEGQADGDGSDGVYALAISLQLKEVNLPDEYRQAVQEKQSAGEDINLAKNQRTQETTKATTELLTARKNATKILDAAMNDANITLTEAALKAEATTFAFRSEAKIIMDVKASLNLTTEGVLAFLSNQLYQNVETLRVSAAEPAKLSRVDEL